MRLPQWVPYPIAWLKAVILVIILSALGAALNNMGDIAIQLAKQPESIAPAVALVILSPIFLIGSIHYLIHKLLQKLTPSVQSLAVQKNLLLFSIWEGLCGWLALSLSLVVIFAVFSTTSMSIEDWATASDQEFGWLGVLALVIVSYVYQVEHLVAEALLSERS